MSLQRCWQVALIASSLFAQTAVERPKILGVAHMAST